jgi:hypothetical protein
LRGVAVVKNNAASQNYTMICKSRLVHIQDTSLCTAAALYYKRQIVCIIEQEGMLLVRVYYFLMNLWKCKLLSVREDLGHEEHSLMCDTTYILTKC